MKILVCGDRNWTNIDVMRREFNFIKGEDVTIIHGDCRGADKMAGRLAIEFGFKVIAVPAEWEKYGKRAGAVRNRKMYDENQPNFVMAFHEHIDESKGTKDMIAYATKKRCPSRLVSK